MVEPYTPGDETSEPISARYSCEVHPDDPGDVQPVERRPAFGIVWGTIETLDWPPRPPPQWPLAAFTLNAVRKSATLGNPGDITFRDYRK